MFAEPNEWGLIIPSVPSATRPTAGFAPQVTPGENAYGSWLQLLAGAAVTHDSYGIWINVHSGNTSASARDILVTLGIDPAGGTSYTDWIPHLAAACASGLGGSSAGFSGGGVSYFLPVFLKAGTSIAAKASVNNATVGAVRVQCRLLCKPSNPDAIWAGSFVQAFGATPATSSGTPITPGTTVEGDWFELGTLTKPLRWLEFGFGVNDGALTANTYHVDIGIGDASNKRVIIQDGYVEVTAVEGLIKHVGGAAVAGAVGDKLYGRAQVGPAASGSNVSLIAYGVG